MITFNQLGRGVRKPKIRKLSSARGLLCCPQKRGAVVFIRERKPKKPNSARRKVAKVKLSTKRKVNCYIPGIGHNLRAYSQVLVRGGRVKDLPGIQYHLIRGKFDFGYKEKFTRKNKKTKYGIPTKQLY